MEYFRLLLLVPSTQRVNIMYNYDPLGGEKQVSDSVKTYWIIFYFWYIRHKRREKKYYVVVNMAFIERIVLGI